MQRSKFLFLSSFAVAALTALVLTGCGPSSESAEPSTPGTGSQSETQPDDTSAVEEASTNSSGSGGEVVLSYGDTTYTAQLQFCALSDEDALFHGTAYDASGAEIGYLGGDFGWLNGDAHGEARINFGATGQFESSDDFIAMGTVAGDMVITDFSDTNLIVMGGAWEGDGTKLPTATLKVTC